MPAQRDDRYILTLTASGDLADMAVLRVCAEERVSRPFEIELELVGTKGQAAAGAADPEGILGQPVGILVRGTQPIRHFHGVVTEFAYTGYDERFHLYRAVLRPSFWLLTRRADCRIFQDSSVVDIFKKVCQEARFSEYRLALAGSYPAREYCVQYRESDFDFLSRLLEHEGIYYYFEHLADRHVMVLVDEVGKLTAAEGYEDVPYYPPGGRAAWRDHLSTWTMARSFEAAAVAARDVRDGSSAGLADGVSQVARRRPDDVARFELFEYPAGVAEISAASVERVAKLRAEQLQAAQTLMRGSGDAAGLAAGRLFRLTDHPSATFNKQYLITASRCVLQGPSRETGEPMPHVSARIEIEAIDAREPYRPPRLTPKPLIQGTQTAVVVSTSSESEREIEANALGCVRVQFPWSRVGKHDRETSCWVRVAQVWAGKQWGALYVPRVGQEVVVSFIDGDPDRPLIIGSVYNPDLLPPYSPESQPTVSGIKSRSSADGTVETFNEIRFDDKKGAEEIYIHAEKNLNLVVENDQIVTIGADKKDPGDRRVTIANDDTLEVGRHLDTTVKGKETRSVTEDRTTTVKGNDTQKVDRQYELTAGEQITLKVGQASIVMKADGSIEISGIQLKLSGNAKVEIDGTQTSVSGQQLDVKGTKTAVQGSAMLDLASSGVASLKGSLTKIG